MIEPTDDIAQLKDSLPKGRALVGLDLGSKVVGVAVSDPLWTVASPLVSLKRKQFKKLAASILEIADGRDAGGYIVGLPRNMDGSEGPSCQSARAFAANLASVSNAPVGLWDERLSTVEAERSLIAADISRSRRRELVDKVAASIILQGALDRLSFSGSAA